MGIYVHDLRSKKKRVAIHSEADVKMRTSNLYPYPYSATHLVHSSDYEEVWFRDGFKIKEPLTAAELREKNQPIWQV